MMDVPETHSEPFAGSDDDQLSLWRIDFEPDSEEVNTWDDVFDIRARYRRDVLDPSFKRWLRDFKAWCRSTGAGPGSSEQLIDAIRRYCSYYEEIGFSDRGFLKTAVFKMLLRHCEQGNQRLINLLLDLVKT